MAPFSEINQDTLDGTSNLFLLCFSPVGAVLGVIGITISVGLTQFIARVLGGTGSFFKLIYAYAAFTAPLFLITSILQPIPVVGRCLSVPLGIYSLALYIIATKAVNGFGWGKSILAVIIIPMAIGLLLVCILSLLLILLVPDSGGLFPDLAMALSTATP